MVPFVHKWDHDAVVIQAIHDGVIYDSPECERANEGL